MEEVYRGVVEDKGCRIFVYGKTVGEVLWRMDGRFEGDVRLQKYVKKENNWTEVDKDVLWLNIPI